MCNVTVSNKLRHIDTNHKLVRCCMIIFGAVDGFSWLRVSLEYVGNNKFETLLSCFMKGVRTCGVPSQVRSDKEKENVLIADFMIANWWPERESICCKSTFNQRIERLNEEMCIMVSSGFWRMKIILTPSLSLILQHFITCFCLLLMTSLMPGDRHGTKTVREQ